MRSIKFYTRITSHTIPHSQSHRTHRASHTPRHRSQNTAHAATSHARAPRRRAPRRRARRARRARRTCGSIPRTVRASGSVAFAIARECRGEVCGNHPSLFAPPRHAATTDVIRRRTSRHGAAITRQAVQGTRAASFDASRATGAASATRDGRDRRERAISNRGNGIRTSGAHRLTTHARAFATNRRQIRNVGYRGRIRYRMEVRLGAD